jgi:cytochrome c-type biogenesis protein CcmH/NrfG
VSVQAESETRRAGRSRRRWLLGGLAVLVGLLLVGVTGLKASGRLDRYWPWTVPIPAVLVVDRADPDLARILERARSKVEANPRSAPDWLQYGMILEVMVFPEHAVAAYREAHRLDPDNTMAKYYLAIALANQREIEQSARLLRELEAADPRYPPFPAHLGDVLVLAGQHAEAVVAYRRALALDPEYPFAHRQLGLALLAQGDAEGAIASLEKAISLQDDDRRTFTALSQAYQMKGDPAKAAELAAQAEELTEHLSTRDSLRLPIYRLRPEVRNARMEAHFAMQFGRYAEAIAPLRTMLTGWPTDPEVLSLLSQAYAETDQPELAEHYRQRAEDAIRAGATPEAFGNP